MKVYAKLLIILFAGVYTAKAQEFSSLPSLSLYTGMVNYEGDLKPNSFTFSNSNPFVSVSFRLPIKRWLSWRSGVSIGKVEGADQYNRGYLQPRNLSFFTSLKDVFTGAELSVFDLSTHRFTPYVFLGIALFKFNPKTLDEAGNRVYLRPLSTEGQGLPDYPDRKPYRLTQAALTHALGMKYALNDCIWVGMEFSQRKTFTDYLDDVSSFYVDQQKLLAARGQKAVDLAYRGDELPNGGPYPPEGEQRGTPTEQDWYYFLGVTVEVKFQCIKSWLPHINARKKSSDKNFSRCPKFY